MRARLCGRLSVDPTLPSHYRVSVFGINIEIQIESHTVIVRRIDVYCIFPQWLSLVTLAVVYNLIFVIGRAVFWEINNKVPALWFTLDYVCDLVYVIDTLVHAHEGK